MLFSHKKNLFENRHYLRFPSEMQFLSPKDIRFYIFFGASAAWPGGVTGTDCRVGSWTKKEVEFFRGKMYNKHRQLPEVEVLASVRWKDLWLSLITEKIEIYEGTNPYLKRIGFLCCSYKVIFEFSVSFIDRYKNEVNRKEIG
jgi:hypothetical protein